MRSKQLAAAVLCLTLVLALCACGKSEAEPAQQPSPSPSSEPMGFEHQDMGVVATMVKGLSPAQMQLITGSIEIVDSEAKDAGVKMTLVSAMGDGCFNCFNVLVELPENSSIEKGGYGFQRAEIMFNDPQAPFTTTDYQCNATNDDKPNDNKYTLRLTVGASRWDNKEYNLDNGLNRTLRLKNIVSDEGEIIYGGQWDFDFSYAVNSEYIELIDRPVPVYGISENGKYGKEKWGEISSFVLSNFSAECRYRIVSGKVSEPYSYGLAYVEMKSGERHLIGCDSRWVDEETDVRDYYFVVPIIIDQVKCIRLTDSITLDIS